MHRGLDGGRLAVEGGGKPQPGTVLSTGLDGGALGVREHALPPLVGGALGEVGAVVLAVVLFALLGLALSHSRPSVFSRSETPDGRDRDPTVESDETAAVAGTEDDTPDPVEREQTDREKVVEMLGANDGRMRQAAIVDNTDWSKSKVSMVLSEMEENGEITKLRVGRENIVSLQGNEPEAAGSPFKEK